MGTKAYSESNVSMRADYDPSSIFASDLDAFNNPDEDYLLDQLEQARANRGGFYKRLQDSAARAKLPEDFRFQTSTGNQSHTPREKSISDGGPSVDSIQKIPEPHTSWRFYTSYDNGEWRRHAVPVYKSEEEIMRDGKSSRKEKDLLSSGSESSLRRMRMSRPSGIDSLNYRRYGGSADGQRLRTVSERGGNDGVMVEVKQSIAPFVQRRRTEGGERVIYPRTQEELFNNQEISPDFFMTSTTSYKSECVETRDGKNESKDTGKNANRDVGKNIVVTADVTKSTRPRIYGGFEEKIIIPTKYKKATDVKEQTSSAVAEVSKSVTESVDTPIEKKVVFSKSVKDNIGNGMRNLKFDSVVNTHGKLENEGKEVKVVIVNSSDEKKGNADIQKSATESCSEHRVPVSSIEDFQRNADEYFQKQQEEFLEKRNSLPDFKSVDKTGDEKSKFTETINIWNPGKPKPEIRESKLISESEEPASRFRSDVGFSDDQTDFTRSHAHHEGLHSERKEKSGFDSDKFVSVKTYHFDSNNKLDSLQGKDDIQPWQTTKDITENKILLDMTTPAERQTKVGINLKRKENVIKDDDNIKDWAFEMALKD